MMCRDNKDDNSMNKIGIITLYEDNFGSILQAFSTYSYISSLGYACDLLKVNCLGTYLNKILKIPCIVYKSLRYKNYFGDRIKIMIASQKERKLLSQNTKCKMVQFIDVAFRIRTVDKKDLKKLNVEYDFFITGSDQVWNGYYDYRFLGFADKEKRIAFAPSFGSELKNYYKKDIKRGLEGFESLSVREESGVQIIRELTGKEAIRLADPTILLTKKEWERFARNGIKKSNYIFVHFLNSPNLLALTTINSYLKEHDCIAYCVCNRYKEYDLLNRYKFIDINPYDYVSLIDNANFVFTDSFHSTLFSLNLETQFLTFERQYLHGNTQSSRIIDLLHRVDMQNHFVFEEIQLDFNERVLWSSDSLFYCERLKLKKFLEKALKRQK